MLYEQANSVASGNGYQRKFPMSHGNPGAARAGSGPHPDGAWVGNRRGMRLYLRRMILRYGRSFLAIIRSPVAIQRWLVVLFILAALSTVIIDGISLSMGFSNLLQREVLAP